MKIRLLPGTKGGLTLPIPKAVLTEMKWAVGDEIVVDVSHSGREVILIKKGSTPAPTRGGVREVVG